MPRWAEKVRWGSVAWPWIGQGPRRCWPRPRRVPCFRGERKTIPDAVQPPRKHDDATGSVLPPLEYLTLRSRTATQKRTKTAIVTAWPSGPGLRLPMVSSCLRGDSTPPDVVFQTPRRHDTRRPLFVFGGL